MKYIGDIEELDIQTAINFSKQGIDVFNPEDDFFNDICYPYDDPKNRDINLNDRRSDFYQNATFCQNGCSYSGMNYHLIVANCICDISVIQKKEINNTESKEIDGDVNKFKMFTKTIISNLIYFNFEILRCFDLSIKTKILINNIGFYILFGMMFLQIIFFIFYLVNKVKPIESFLLNCKDISKINNNIKIINNSNSNPPKKK